MAIVNRKIGVSGNKKLSRAVKRALYNNKYFEHNEIFFKNLEYEREINKAQIELY